MSTTPTHPSFASSLADNCAFFCFVESLCKRGITQRGKEVHG